MKNLQTPEIWYVTGSQHLYGEQTLRQVAANSQKIVEELNGSGRLPLKLVFKPTVTRQPSSKSHFTSPRANVSIPPIGPPLVVIIAK